MNSNEIGRQKINSPCNITMTFPKEKTFAILMYGAYGSCFNSILITAPAHAFSSNDKMSTALVYINDQIEFISFKTDSKEPFEMTYCINQ